MKYINKNLAKIYECRITRQGTTFWYQKLSGVCLWSGLGLHAAKQSVWRGNTLAEM